MRNSLIVMVAKFLFWRSKQIFFLVIKLEPWLLSRLQPRRNNCVPKYWMLVFRLLFEAHMANLKFEKSKDKHFCSHPACIFVAYKLMVKNKIPKEPSSITFTDSLDSQSCQKLKKNMYKSWQRLWLEWRKHFWHDWQSRR